MSDISLKVECGCPLGEIKKQLSHTQKSTFRLGLFAEMELFITGHCLHMQKKKRDKFGVGFIIISFSDPHFLKKKYHLCE